jgi:hypothetical protein
MTPVVSPISSLQVRFRRGLLVVLGSVASGVAFVVLFGVFAPLLIERLLRGNLYVWNMAQGASRLMLWVPLSIALSFPVMVIVAARISRIMRRRAR